MLRDNHKPSKVGQGYDQGQVIKTYVTTMQKGLHVRNTHAK